MKYVPFNINSQIKVKLTERGHEILRKHTEDLRLIEPNYPDWNLNEDAEGYSKWHMWDLMNWFGEFLYNGCDIPFETEILIREKDLK